jgi:TatD DNase family protein
MRWAVERNRPIIIHTREATEDTLRLVKEFVPQGIRGVFHCFSGSYETAQQIIQMGFYLGIGGVVTYPKAGLAEVVARIDAAHLVLETDAPYLSPAPHRGKRNESAYVNIVAEKVASLKEVSVTDLIAVTGRNALKLFGE